MAEQILDQVRDVFEGQIVSPFCASIVPELTAANKAQDFEGQRLVELLVNVALTLVGVGSDLTAC
jgi:hypothetical protein